MQNFTPLPLDRFHESPFKILGNDWMLLTAGTMASWNTMTVSWGGFGRLWEKDVAYVFVRPTRYTFEWMEKSAFFTLCFFPEDRRPALAYCGSHSGRDVDKAKETGLLPLATTANNVIFEQARMAIECRTLYSHDMDPARMLDPAIKGFYPGGDYHRMYIAEVLGIWQKS